MPQETPENQATSEPARSTPREQARKILQRLEGIILSIYQAETDADATQNPTPTDLAAALIYDAASLLEGISDGWIETGQPRIATDLLQAVAQLEKTQHNVLAIEIGQVLRPLSLMGLAAENCELGRNRHRGNGPKDIPIHG